MGRKLCSFAREESYEFYEFERLCLRRAVTLLDAPLRSLALLTPERAARQQRHTEEGEGRGKGEQRGRAHTRVNQCGAHAPPFNGRRIANGRARTRALSGC